MDKLNQKNVREALRRIVKNDVQQNEWILVRAYDEAVLKKHTWSWIRRIKFNRKEKKNVSTVTAAVSPKCESII